MALKLSDLPEVSFAEKDINVILSESISGYEQAYFESTGVRKILNPGDPIRIWIYAQALRELQLRVLIDDAGKQNLLKYARGNNLINLGAFTKTNPFEMTASKTKIKFVLSVARPTDELVPSGIRVSPGGDIYFSVDEDNIVPAGAIEIEVAVTCTEVGSFANGYLPGQINILVDPIPWVASVTNTETSQGGTDAESDDNYRERIHLAPEGFSVAGPTGAYEYFTRNFSPLISDVRVTSPLAGVVEVLVLLQNGTLPSPTFLSGLGTYLSDKERRPLTDNVTVAAPNTVTYNLDLTYYLRMSDSENLDSVKDKITKAINEYKTWQLSKIGRDINPSELMARVILAGAKRAEITSPVFTSIDENEVAIVNIETVNYGGLEDE